MRQALRKSVFDVTHPTNEKMPPILLGPGAFDKGWQ